MDVPACMTPDELELWKEQAALVRKWGQANAAEACFDCTLAFSAEMRAIGRCNGTPGEPPRPVTESRRKSNRRCQQRYRERHQERIRERRRAYFEARWRKRFEVDEPHTGTLG
jgi:hypothetical protein